MTHIEQAIRDAVEKGGYRDDLLKDNPNADIDGLADTGYFARAPEKKLLDREFWKALEKAGYSDGEYIHGLPKSQVREKWHYLWVRFIDHLADGKDAESFFASL